MAYLCGRTRVCVRVCGDMGKGKIVETRDVRGRDKACDQNAWDKTAKLYDDNRKT